MRIIDYSKKVQELQREYNTREELIRDAKRAREQGFTPADTDYDLFISQQKELLRKIKEEARDLGMDIINGYLVPRKNQEPSTASSKLYQQWSNESFSLKEETTFNHYREKFGIVAHSRAMLKVFSAIEKYKDSITVLITGKTGTGKELVAETIKKLSNRNKKTYVRINCGAISTSIIDSELFGAKKGAYTDAKEDRIGYFEEADQGTIFLDEIGELPREAQVKLLRVLDNGEFMRVGDTKTRRVDVRVIAATNKDLQEEMKAGRFRGDLFYRINQADIQLPPLRERLSDIQVLCEYFFRDPKGGIISKTNEGIPFPIYEWIIEPLISQEWNGNVRELKDLMRKIYLS